MLPLGWCQMVAVWLGSLSICEPADLFSGSKVQKRYYDGALKCLELGSCEELGTEGARPRRWSLAVFTHQQSRLASKPLNDRPG